MDSQIKKLKKVREQLVEKATKRDEKYVNRSEKWQQSVRGLVFEKVTQNIGDAVEALDKTIRQLEIAKEHA